MAVERDWDLAVPNILLMLIQGKWIKKYETHRPIELLAYYSRHPTIPEAFWLGPVQSFVDANWTTSPFRKVWIFDPGSERILFAVSRDK